MGTRILRALGVGLAVGVLVVLLGVAGVFEGFELRTYDARVRALAEPSVATDDIVLILLDQQSLDWASEGLGIAWPWPRELYGAVTQFVDRAGAKALVYDVIFADPSLYGVYDDMAFADALSAYGRGILAASGTTDGGGQTEWNTLTNPLLGDVPGLSSWLSTTDGMGATSLEFSSVLFPNDDLLPSAAGVGSVRFPEDPDGVYRRGTPFSLFDDQILPGLALAAYVVGADGPVEMSIEPGTFRLDGKKMPIDDRGRAVLRYRTQSSTHQAINAAAIIESELQLLEGGEPLISPDELAGKYVFFGFSAPGLLDLRPTPLGPVVPGVEVHAALLDNLLTGEFITPVSRVGEIVLGVIFALVAALGITLISGSIGNVSLILGFTVLPTALGLGLYLVGIWFPIVLPTVASIGALVGATVLNYASEGRQKRYIKNAFRQYLSPAVIEQLIENPDKLKLGGERRELSIFFSDLQGFTSLSEGLSPEDLTSLLNEYLSAMTDIIQGEGGTIDKYEGDAIIAFWNAPLPLEDHAQRAVRAALACQTELARLRPVFAQRTGKDLFMRIGINTGPAVVGNMGSRTRFDYTMLGDAVNLAARLEGINKQFGTYTMISQATLDATRAAFPTRELSRVAVVGRAEPVVVYEPLTLEQAHHNKELHEKFSLALKLFYQGNFARAQLEFDTLASKDPASKHYSAKCTKLRQEYGDIASPEVWKGVWVMTEK